MTGGVIVYALLEPTRHSHAADFAKYDQEAQGELRPNLCPHHESGLSLALPTWLDYALEDSLLSEGAERDMVPRTAPSSPGPCPGTLSE